MSTTNNHPKPLNIKDRIAYLDILRGIAILFIFTANIVFFSGLFLMSTEQQNAMPLAPIDKVLDFVMFTLVDGKFYSIFSLLFGIGFVVQYNNLKKYNKPFVPFFSRRMFWLLLIGLCHLFLFWIGDILTLYALLGFVLIVFRNTSNTHLLRWAAILLLLPIIHWLGMQWLGYYPYILFEIYSNHWQSLGLPMGEFNGQPFPDMIYYLKIDTLTDFFKLNLTRPLIRYGMILLEGRAFKVLGIFLIGMWAGRKILNENLLSNTKFLKKIALIGVLLGLPMSCFRTYIEFYTDSSTVWTFLKYVTYALGTVPLAIGYAALIALACQNKTTWLRWFTPVGRMALTNYLCQTLIAITLFHGFGFGLATKLGFTALMGIAICVFTIQNILSKWWLNHFKYGPMEWIWRQLTYGKTMPLRKKE